MPVEHRSKVMLLINISYAIGESLVGVWAVFIRRWRPLQLTIALPALILATYYW